MLEARSDDQMTKVSVIQRLAGSSRVIERVVMFTILWWAIAEGYPGSWTFGVGFIALATITSLMLTPRRTWRLRPVGFLRFAGFFIWHSVAGGVDVSLRAIRPSMPISPGFMSVPIRLSDVSARVLLADTVSLLPGTLSAGLSGDLLVIHVLDCRLPIVEDVRRVEDRISDALGIELAPAVPMGDHAAGGQGSTGGEDSAR